MHLCRRPRPSAGAHPALGRRPSGPRPSAGRDHPPGEGRRAAPRSGLGPLTNFLLSESLFTPPQHLPALLSSNAYLMPVTPAPVEHSPKLLAKSRQTPMWEIPALFRHPSTKKKAPRGHREGLVSTGRKLTRMYCMSRFCRNQAQHMSGFSGTARSSLDDPAPDIYAAV